MKSRPNK